MNDEQQAPSAIPEGVQGNLYRSKHHGARQLRKRARLQKRLLKAGVIRKRPRRKAAA